MAIQSPTTCAEELGLAYSGKTLILDANVIMNDENALEKFPGATIIIPSALLEELDNNKSNLNVGQKVRAFVRQLVFLLRESDEKTKTSIAIANGTTIVLDPSDYIRALKGTAFDRKKADNVGYLAAALAYQDKKADVTLVTDDLLLEIKATAMNVKVEPFRGNAALARKTQAVSDDELPMIEITDDEMLELIGHDELPKPEGLEIQPNTFVQFFSPTHPASHQTIARYQFKRPVTVYKNSSLTPTDIRDGEFKLGRPVFPGTLRLSIDSEPIPELADGSEHGWYWDSSDNKVVLVGKFKAALYEDSNVLIEAQTEPHRMLRMKSFKELGLWNLRSRSLEQTMAVNLAMDLGHGIDCLIQEGKAGTSKTFNTVVAAMKLREQGRLQSVILSRPPAAMGGHTSGYLPGDSDDKNMPWMEPYIDNVLVVEEAQGRIQRMTKNGKRPEMPAGWTILDYGFIRGRSLANTLISLDEFQNTRALEADAILTRISSGSAYMIMGDVSQIDPPLTMQNNGLSHLINMVTDPSLTPEQRSRVGYIRLKKGVRHPFAELIAEQAKKFRTAR
ncbi:MAG: PhoH family protein [Bdellovibrionales bacterium]|nr:PhoH family protein [Bdellovibrionales bacterium]